MSSCPNCGFDLGADGRCVVCGYQSEASRPTESVVAASGERGRSTLRPDAGESLPAPPRRGGGLKNRRRTSLPPILAAALAFVVLIAVGFFVASHRSSGAGGQSAQTRAGASGDASVTKLADSTPQTTPARIGETPSPSPAGHIAKSQASQRTNGSAGGAPPPISSVGFSAPVGASPVAIRATHPVDLYNPSRQPVFNIAHRTQFPPLTSEHAYVHWMLDHTHQQEKFLRERWIRAMKAYHRHLVVHRRVLTAFLLTPREWFVRPYNLKSTYENTALPIGYGQTISGPDLVAHMTDALDPQPNQRVLEIGTGSGYQSAVLSQLSNYVYTIEIVRPLAEQTNQIYLEHTKAMPEYANIHRRLADGYYGWPAYAPFDRIIVTTGIDHIPPDLLKELKPGGIMVIPIGPPTGQTILKITKSVDKEGRVHLKRQNLYPGVTDIFVPFTATGGGTHNSKKNAE